MKTLSCAPCTSLLLIASTAPVRADRIRAPQ